MVKWIILKSWLWCLCYGSRVWRTLTPIFLLGSFSPLLQFQVTVRNYFSFIFQVGFDGYYSFPFYILIFHWYVCMLMSFHPSLPFLLLTLFPFWISKTSFYIDLFVFVEKKRPSQSTMLLFFLYFVFNFILYYFGLLLFSLLPRFFYFTIQELCPTLYI